MTINDTIQQSLTANGLGQYTRQATPVVDALVQREQAIVTSLLDAAEEAGVSRADAVRTFEGLGLSMPAAAAPADDAAARLAALEAFARANGFRG